MTIEGSLQTPAWSGGPRTRVKICGITSVADALAAVGAGADALGFVFYPDSPRYVRPEVAAEIVRALPPFVARVGLFVNESQEAISATILETGIDTIQLHGDEPPSLCRLWRGSIKVIKAFRVRDRHSLVALSSYADCADAFLLDAYVAGVPGGTGTAFNWELAREAGSYRRPIILAGGLHPGNVSEAIATVKPFALDVSSGVERAPGKKDHDKVAAFIQAAAANG